MENEEIEKQVIEITYNKKDKKLISEVFTKMVTEKDSSTIIISKEQCKAIMNYVDLLENVIDEILEGLKANIIE